MWVHSSSVADHLPRPPSSKSASRIITAAFLIRQNACLFRSELAQDRASDAQAQDSSEEDVEGLTVWDFVSDLIYVWRRLANKSKESEITEIDERGANR